MIFADLTPPPPALLLAVHPAVYAVGSVVVLILLLLVAWLIFRHPLERRRIYRRAQRLLHEGQWEAALMTIRSLRDTGALSELWQGRLQNTEGECQRCAGEAVLREQRFEEGLEHFRASAALLKLDSVEGQARVIEAMLAEVRRRFAEWPKETVSSCQDLIGRVLLMQANSAEAHFWKGLCLVREEQWAAAVTTLQAAYEAAGKKDLDPSLYLGILLCRSGQAQDAVRFLAEANRIDSNCPLVTWQLGVAMLAAGGDSALAVRALQRAVGARGLSPWIKKAERMWQEGFPEGRSYVRRLAARHAYRCPLLGNDPATMLRQAQMGLAQAYYRNGNFEEAAELYGKLLQDCPPTAALLRGLGLALTRLERYDQAFKHLRTAFEEENPKNHLTAGYLALCGALGKPTQEEDKRNNLAWAIQLLARFEAPGDAEWARLYSAVFAAARAVQMPLPIEDQVRLCNVLASVHGVDPAAAAAYDLLAAASSADVRSEYAWLYAQASMSHSSPGSQDLALFSRTVREAEAARRYFAERQWDFDAIEYACLERHAAQQPGRFPQSLGPDYPKRGETLLLTWSRRLEEAGQPDAAKVCIEVLYKLDPRSTVALDRLAQLAYHRGDLDRAAEMLAGWDALEPANPWPLVRRAIVEQERGQPGRRAEAMDAALQRTNGPLRASVAYLGARLALRQSRGQKPDSSAEMDPAEKLLLIALQEEPGHVSAICCLAALRAATGRLGELAELASRMNRPEVADARFHLLASACHLAAGDHDAALQAAQRVLADGAFAAEAQFVIGLTHLQRGDSALASTAFREVATLPQSSASDDSRARLGQISLRGDECDEAIAWWSALDPAKRRELHLDRPLQDLVFLAGINALRNGDHKVAAGRLVEARRLGCEDPRLAALLPLALLKAGQQLLFQENERDTHRRSLDPRSNGRAHGTGVDSGCMSSIPSQRASL